MKRHLFLFWLVLLIAAAVDIAAQDPTSTPTMSPDLGRVGVDMTQQRPLTLRETIELALENNKDIEVSRKTARMAEFDLQATRGFFQPRLTGQSYFEHSTTPNVSIFSNNQKTNQGAFVGNAALQAFVPTFGTAITGSFNNSRLTTDNPISILSPQYNSSVGLAVTQPLFRGRRFDQSRRTIEIARRNMTLTETQFKQRSIEIVTVAEKAYWDLAFALRNLQVQRDGASDAKSQLEHNRRLVSEGQLAPIDIVAAETQAANFEQAVYDALNIVNQAENGLKNLIAANRTDQIWSQPLTPIDSVELVVPRTTLTEAMDAALRDRPELAINRVQKDINALDQRLYRDQKKPQIDLIASYSSAGIGGGQNPDFSPAIPTACTRVPPDPVGCAQLQANLALLTGNPFRGIIANRYPVFRVGVQFNLPLFGDKSAGAQLGKSLVESGRIETQREQIEQGIEVDVRNALQAIRTAEARLRFATIARENSEKQYDSEQRKLDAGQSDTYKVLERQTALTAARSSELRARTDLNKAIAELHRATGNTLKANDIETKLKK